GALVPFANPDAGKEQQHQRDQEQYAPCRRELHHHRPKQSARDPPEALPAGLPLHRLTVHFLGIELVTRVRVSAKLSPKLLDRNPFADPLPEISKPSGHSAQV